MTDKSIKNKTIKISGTIIKGYGVASGSGEDKTFPAGTIKMQAPFFKKLGLDISNLYICLLYTSPSPRDKRQSRMPSSA